MFELPSAFFLMADGSEFRFARFYIVCEAIRLGALERPPIVCELPDTPRGLSKRGKTQHSMPDAARKNYLDFAPKNSPLLAVFRNIECLKSFAYSLSPACSFICRGLSDTALPV